MKDGRKTAGITAEFNPFHEGHQHFLDEIRSQTGAEYIVAVMSGDFVQRGGPAAFSKYARAQQALKSGCDMVLELPARFSTASAEGFAQGAVSILNLIPEIDLLCFGSESGDLARMRETARFLHENERNSDSGFSRKLREELKGGLPYPAARERALADSGISFTESGSNDILGVEYLKALLNLRSRMVPHAILRDSSFRSAHGIRDELMKSGEKLPTVDDYSDFLTFRLTCLRKEGIPLTEFLDVSEELAARISRDVGERLDFQERIRRLKNRSITWTRAARALLHILLGIRKVPTLGSGDGGCMLSGFPRIRVLGIQRRAEFFLRNPHVFTSISREMQEHPENPVLEEDLFAEEIYRLCCPRAGNAMTEKLLVL